MKRNRTNENIENGFIRKLQVNEIKGWGQENVLMEPINSRPNRTYVKSAKISQNHKKSLSFCNNYVNPIQMPSNLDLLKKEIQYLQNETEQRFPSSFNNFYYKFSSNSILLQKQHQQSKKIKLNPQNEQVQNNSNKKKQPINRSPIINNLMNDIFIHRSISIRPASCCERRIQKNIKKKEDECTVIHHRKDYQIPFKGLFLKKRNQKRKMSIDAFLVGQIEGRRLSKKIFNLESEL